MDSTAGPSSRVHYMTEGIPSLPVLFQARSYHDNCVQLTAGVSLGSGKRRNNKQKRHPFQNACKCWTSSDIWPKAKCLSFQGNDGIVRLGPPRERVKVLMLAMKGIKWFRINS